MQSGFIPARRSGRIQARRGNALSRDLAATKATQENPEVINPILSGPAASDHRFGLGNSDDRQIGALSKQHETGFAAIHFYRRLRVGNCQRRPLP
jgi:hypothetical protein